MEDKTQNASLTSSELLLKPVLWRGEMNWPQREGQTTRGSPFDDWQAFLLFAALQNSYCLCWPTPCQMFCQLQFWVWFLMPGSSCRWINEVPTIKIHVPAPPGEIFMHGICSHYGWGEVRVGGGGSKEHICCVPIQLLLPVSSKLCLLITCLRCQECLTG